MMDHLTRISKLEKQSQQEEKIMYRKELDQLVESKFDPSRENKSMFYQPQSRHNPITNPIDGHVENPYFVKKLGNRLQP